MTLDMIPWGAQARVISIDGYGCVALRLMEMGMVPGAPVEVVRAAPLGDPLQVCVREYQLALRREEAKTIHVTLTED